MDALVTVPFSAVLGLQGILWPRAMLLRADLAAALGYPTEAHMWYGRWLELWAKADAGFLPHVERARRAPMATQPR